MARQGKSKLWKLHINEKAGLETVESALAEACKQIIQKAYADGPSFLLERVDMRAEETTVYISGNERTANHLSKVLGARMPRAKIVISNPGQKEIKQT